ncbi:MAG: hypothetical protein K2K21_02445 [Lachnospiraceae bacterium]|nr:hypothetical protein [Lachnospiraceae bacterium]
MEKNGMVKRLLVVLLLVIAVIGLNMQGTSVFAETLTPEAQSEMTEDQSESRSEITEAGESVEQTETEETEPSENKIETVPEQSVSGNDISDEEAENPNEIIEVLDDEGTDNTLTDEILNKCIVNGMNPQGVTVNLFDYWQGTAPDGSSEVAHDYYYNWSIGSGADKKPDVEKDSYVTTYNLGISKNHLLRFGYRGNETHDFCQTTVNGIQLGDYGVWNEYDKKRPSQGIVKNILGPDGFPLLNLLGKNDDYFGRYADADNRSAYLTENNKTESLAYLFSPNVQNQFKASYSAVQGLFRQGNDGYYYYNSRENFASFNNRTNSFTLYNSPGVAKANDDNSDAEFCGQFFPFNTAYDVYDSYIENNDGSYQLTYKNLKNQGDSDYAPVIGGGNSYIKCYAPNLNHYLGLTLEMSFVQPVGGRVISGNDKSDEMIFRFSGDDDVWIFIDDVMVADLGGIHDALELSINFATGVVNVEGSAPYTLYDAFVTAYGENSTLGGVEFNGRTFADNTTHTLKMFYLERGHMASNLSLSFNIQPLPSPPSNNEDKDKDKNSYETEEHTSAPVEIPVSDNTLYDNTEIPKTGDDSMIGLWAALCILSLIGIGATVCNLIIRKRKQNK